MKQIKLYKFHKHKYGNELLIDTFDIDYIRERLHQNPVHRETFFCIIFVIRGEENISVNEHRRLVSSGDIICSRPGELWQWQSNTQLDGRVLIFEGNFLLSFFNNTSFIDNLSYLNPERKSPFIRIDNESFDLILTLLGRMRKEIDGSAHKDHHLLRALLYETLTLLNRAGISVDNTLAMGTIATSRHIEGFRRAVDENYKLRHEVEYYAEKLCVTPNYLNKIVRNSFGATAKEYIRIKLFDEAKRLLTYTSLSVKEIAASLNFASSSHFICFFKKYSAKTTTQYRQNAMSPQL